ncbi:MAG: hypothetical protein ACRDMV_21035 [Streptosporangiales bacterium]
MTAPSLADIDTDDTDTVAIHWPWIQPTDDTPCLDGCLVTMEID